MDFFFFFLKILHAIKYIHLSIVSSFLKLKIYFYITRNRYITYINVKPFSLFFPLFLSLIMKASFLYLAAALVAATASAAETPAITKIPFYYHQKRSSSDDFISAASEDLQNGMLGGVIQIGNPPQNFTVAFDTSSGFTWVRSVLCESENCQGRNAYDARNSTSAVSTGRPFQTTSYGNAVARTTIYQDTFRFAGMTVKHMPFGGAYDMQGFDEGFDGFLGLGRDVDLNITSPQKRDVSSSGFVANAYQQGSGISSAQFGMYTTSSSGFSQSGSTPAKRSVKREDPAGYLIFGGVDKEAIQGDLYHIDTDKDNGSGNWVVPVKQAEFLKELDFKVDKHAKAVLSSSTDVIGLPNSQGKLFVFLYICYSIHLTHFVIS